MYAIINGRAPVDTQVGSISGFSCTTNSGATNAILTKSGDTTFSVELMKYGYDSSNSSTYTDCGYYASKIVSIKSIGVGAGQQRAIEAAVPTAP